MLQVIYQGNIMSKLRHCTVFVYLSSCQSCSVLTSIFSWHVGQMIRFSPHGSHVEWPHWKKKFLLFRKHKRQVEVLSIPITLYFSLSIVPIRCFNGSNLGSSISNMLPSKIVEWETVNWLQKLCNKLPICNSYAAKKKWKWNTVVYFSNNLGSAFDARFNLHATI